MLRMRCVLPSIRADHSVAARRAKSGVSMAALAFAAFIASAAPQGARAEQAIATATEMNGFGRIVLTLPKPIETAARSSNGILVVTFAEPVDLDFSKLPLEAPEYIAVVRRDPDRKTLRFAMTQPFSVDLKMAGEKAFIDLLPESWQGMPPGLPSDVVAELARRARAAEEAARQAAQADELSKVRPLGIRVGTAPTFTRIVFDTEIVVPVQFNRNGSEARLVFDAALRADPEELRSKLAGIVRDFRIETGDRSLTLIMTIPAETPVKGFREDDSFVLDLIDAEAERLRKSEALALAAQEELAAKQETVVKTPPADAQAEAGDIAKPAEPPAVLTPAGVPDGEEARKTDEMAAPVDPGVRGRLVDDDTVAIDFNFRRRVPAAMFGGAEALWLVFDSSEPLTLPSFEPEIAKKIASIAADTVGDVQVVRLALAPGVVPSIAALETGWALRLGPDFAEESRQVALRTSVNQQGRSVMSADLPEAGKVVWLDNAETGERYAVALSSSGPAGLPKSRRFVEFAALRSLQGLAFSQIADDLTVTSGLDEVTVARGQGLAVTQDQPAPNVEASVGGLLVNASAWNDDIKGDIRSREKSLFQAASAAPTRERSQKRMQLADFYLANRLPAEAIGVIETVIKEDPATGQTPTTKLALAIALATNGMPEDALRALSDKALQDNPEIDLWRGYVAARGQDWQTALVAFRKALPTLDLYPDRLQAIFRPMLVNAAIESDDYNFASSQLDLYERLRTGTERPDLANLLRARIAEASGRADDALALYDQASASPDRDVEARARLFRALLKNKEKRSDNSAVEAELETLGVIWRGDELELKSLDVLSGLYAANGRWREAFGATRRALEINSEHKITRAIQDKMGLAFEKLFLDGKAAELDKLKALALYYDFRNFTPPGRKGDEIVRHLADRLISLDLLEEAAALLDHQVKHRLEGAARSSVATKLAVVYLQDAKPVEALRILKETRLQSLPDELKRARALVEARALAELTRTDLAIEMIANQKGPEIDRLRADIYWSGKRWREAGEAYELVAGETWRDAGHVLSETERSDVMRAAIAYVLSEEGLSLARLTSKFADKMAATPDANAFALVSSDSGAKQADFRDIAKAAVSSSTLTEFLRSYRERYPNEAGPEPQAADPAAAAVQAPTSPQPMNDEADKPEQAAAPAAGADQRS
jgi:hypothetical protein